MKILIVMVSILILFAQVANADQTQPVAKSEQVTSLYDADAGQANWFNQHKLLVYSRTSRNGEQTDVVRKGNFFKELFIGRDGKIHVRRCGNVVYQIEVERSIVLRPGPAGRNGRNGLDGQDGQNGQNGYDGLDGAPGSRGPRGYRGPKGNQGEPGQGTTIYNFGAPAQMMSMTLGGQYAPIVNNSQLAYMSVTPASRIAISTINNNALNSVNSNANGTVVNLGPGSASGQVASDGNGKAAAKSK